MDDRPADHAVEVRLRDYLAAELRQAELDFPTMPRPEWLPQRRRVALGLVAAAVAVLAFVILAPQFAGSPLGGAGGTPMGADGLPLSIDGEPVVRVADIAARPSDMSFLAGGTLVLDASSCNGETDPDCEEAWQLIAGPIDNPAAAFALQDVSTAKGFVRTSRAPTVARVRASAGEGGHTILVVEAIPWRQPTKGPIPADATPPEGGTPNDALVPDFVSAFGRDGVSIAGYIPKAYLVEGRTPVPGTPSNPPQPEPLPVYGEDLATLVGHMVPGVGFVALGSTASPAGPSASVAAASAGPSPVASVAPSPVPAASAGASLPPGIDCGRIAPAPCLEAIDLARAGHEADVATATRIVVDDTCPPPAVCDRTYPFDSIVVFVTVGGDTTGWYAFTVVGLEYGKPTHAERWWSEVPPHVVAILRAGESPP